MEDSVSWRHHQQLIYIFSSFGWLEKQLYCGALTCPLISSSSSYTWKHKHRQSANGVFIWIWSRAAARWRQTQMHQSNQWVWMLRMQHLTPPGGKEWLHIEQRGVWCYAGESLNRSPCTCSWTLCLRLHLQASDSSLLSRLISICNDGRLSNRLFFILWLRRSCFCLIMAPHIFCSVESSSSSAGARTSSFSSFTLSSRLLRVEEEKPEDWLLDLCSWCPLLQSPFPEPSLLHRPPAGRKWGCSLERKWSVHL